MRNMSTNCLVNINDYVLPTQTLCLTMNSVDKSNILLDPSCCNKTPINLKKELLS